MSALKTFDEGADLMLFPTRTRRKRSLRPDLHSLEGRQLLNAAMPHNPHRSKATAEVLETTNLKKRGKPPAPRITIIGQVSNGGFQFTTFNGPFAGNTAGTGTNMNGLSNSGTSVGVDIDNEMNDHNFTVNPRNVGPSRSSTSTER